VVKMAKYIGKHRTGRYDLPYDEIPTIKGSVWGGSYEPYTPEEYGAILDCVYEMTDMVFHSNGETIHKAMTKVIQDEKWRILPSHQKMLLTYVELAQEN